MLHSDESLPIVTYSECPFGALRPQFAYCNVRQEGRGGKADAVEGKVEIMWRIRGIRKLKTLPSVLSTVMHCSEKLISSSS
jgi:hypothetical protein